MTTRTQEEKKLLLLLILLIHFAYKGGIGKSLWTMLNIFVISLYCKKQSMTIFDADLGVKTTTTLHEKLYEVRVDVSASEDRSRLYEMDVIFDEFSKKQVVIMDTNAGAVTPLGYYWGETGHDVAQELGVTPIGLQPVVRSKESFLEAIDAIERFSKDFHLIIGKNLNGTRNDRNLWTEFAGQPSIRKISSKLQKLIDDTPNVYEVFIPELPADTYSRLLNEGIPLEVALSKSSKLRFAERIRLRNLVNTYVQEFTPILNAIGVLPKQQKPYEQTTTKKNPK